MEEETEENGAGRCVLCVKRAECLDKAGGRNRNGVTQERERGQRKRKRNCGWEGGRRESLQFMTEGSYLL